VAAGFGVFAQPVEGVVVGQVEAGGDQHREPAHRVGNRWPVGRVHHPHLQAGVEGAAVERFDEALVGAFVGGAVRMRQRRVSLHDPAGRHVDEQRHVGVRHDPGDEFAGLLELGAEAGDLGVRPAGSPVVRQDPAPVRLGAEVQGVPVPVADHAGAACDECPGGLAPLPVVGGPAVPGEADVRRVGLGDQERRLFRRVHPVGAEVQRPHPVGGPRLGGGAGVGQGEPVLHDVVRVTGGDVESPADPVVVEGGPVVGEAGGDELLRGRVLPDDPGLPGDELLGLPCLEPPPGQLVLRLRVAVRPPQVGPGGQPVRPVDESPLLVEVLDGPVLVAQVVGEPLEDAVVVQQFQAGFVVDLEADHRGVPGVPAGHPPDDPLGVEPERGMGEVGLLPGAPRDRPAAAPLAGDLRVQAGQPRRHGVGGCAEDDGDAAGLGAVQNGQQPVEVEAALLGFPGGPDRLADADDGESGGGHQVQVGVESIGGLVLVVVGRPEEHVFRHG
jgi:hypothetical protein